MDTESVAAWLDRYLEAWQSYDRGQIADLFSEDVEYRFHPYDEPIVGRDAVIEAWLGESGLDYASDRDEPGTFEASYEPFAVQDDAAVATGSSSYRDEPGGEFTKVYDNCFVMRFDDEGRCRSFTEWYMKRRDP
jgi:ketosteroid isomerase-like protein